MKILEKRPLALILCIMLGGFSFFADFGWEVKLTIASIPLLVIGIIYLFDNLKSGRNPIVIISLIAFSLSVILSLAWSQSFFPHRLYDTNAQIVGRVYDLDKSDSSAASMVLKTDTINGKRDKHTLVLYIAKAEAQQIKEYDVISVTADIKELSSSDDGFDGRSYYVSKGYSARCTNAENLEILYNDVDKLDERFDSLRLKISNRLKMRTDFETGAFLSALIVGDRSDLSANTRLNFARLGISHILALSGMHLAILTLALNFVFVRLGVRKKLRVAILALLVLFYMGLTGFSASVLRSGIMLIISGALYLMASKSDAITSLTISVAVIVLINPASVYDNSLWLSAFATLGVVAFSEIVEKAEKTAPKLQKALLTLKNACLVSFFAFCGTFALVALRYDSFSVVSVFTTLIFSFVIQLFIYGGILLLLLGGIIPFGKLIVYFANAIAWLAELVSSLKIVYVSMSSVAVKLLIVLLTVFFFSFLVFEIKSKRRAVLVIVIMLASVFATAEVHTLIYRYSDDVKYVPSTIGDVMLMKSNGEASVVYSGKAFSDDASDVLEYFIDENLTYIDNIVFASYSYHTMDFVEELISGIKVSKIMLPTPSTEDEIDQAEGISYLLSSFGTSLEFYELYEYIDLGEYKYRLFEKVDYTYGEYPANVYEVVVGDEKYTYLSVCKYDELSVSAKALLYNSENLIIGSIGNSNYYIFDLILPDIKKIYYFDDGRLSDSASEYYKAVGADVSIITAPLELVD